MKPQDFERYVGLPFQDKGRDRNGADCWGLAVIIYREEFKIDLPSLTDEYDFASDESIADVVVAEQESGWVRIPPGEERPGDVIVIRVNGLPRHVAIVAQAERNKRLMLHIERGTDSIIEPYNGLKWNKRILGFFRHKSVMPD